MKILLVLVGRSEIFFEENSKKGFLYNLLINNIKYFEKPLTLPILGALTPREYFIDVVEGGYKDVDFEEKYDLVGISSVTQCALTAYEIADEFRRRGVKVVLGGWHPSALPVEAKQHADSVVIGEAEETWPQFLKDFENGSMKPFYMPERAVDPELIPCPRIELYPQGTGFGIQATRGCPYGCEFCSITHMKFRNKFRKRPISNVVEDIEQIPNKSFFFNDNSLTIDINYTKELFRAMKDLTKRFYAYGNIDALGRDEELLKLANEAGCFGWFIGFESICQESLDNVGKKANRVEDYISSIKKIHDHGMVILGSFMFGFDHDTLNVFQGTDEFIRKSEIDIPYSTLLTPLPGTTLYDDFEKQGRILTKDWNMYDLLHVVYQPKHMTPAELLTNTTDLRKKWYTKSNNIKRMINSLKIGFYPFIFVSSRSMFLRILGY